MNGIIVNFRSIIDLTEEQFYRLCTHNPDTKFERNANGEILIMSPTGGETGKRNSELIIQLGLWNRETKLGVVFDSSTGYILPNGANRSPDVSWIKKERWEQLTNEQKQKFIPLVPDFVVELMQGYFILKMSKMRSRPYLHFRSA
jgi:Uma2 family endonuclease